jgi:hypothetical protein
MRLVAHVARMGKNRNGYGVLVRKPEGFSFIIPTNAQGQYIYIVNLLRDVSVKCTIRVPMLKPTANGVHNVSWPIVVGTYLRFMYWIRSG